jgi:chlorobactene glucosyltransferase
MFFTIAIIFFYVMIAVSAYFFLTAAINVLDMRIRTSKPSIKNGPMVSVLIPVRNEEKNIERCLSSLQNQDYNNYEILVIDDNSDDGTYGIISKIAEQDIRVKAFKGKPLPADWYGKPFALSQLVPHTNGEILLFTDADTIHSPTSVSWAVTNIEATKADLISGYVGQTLLTFGERITVPVIFFLTGFLIPMFLGKWIKSGYFSLAVGQYIIVKKHVLNKTGGFETVKNKTSEDVFLARHIKSLGYKTEFLDITNQAFCRMYTGFNAAIQGIGKNIYDFFNKKPFILFLNAVAIFFFFCLPFPILIFSLFVSNPFMPYLVIVHILFTLTWLALFIGRRINWLNALVWPIMHINLLFMVLWSFYRTVSGRGFTWKDRIVS